MPKHHHENEQLTYILEGALRFRLGDNLEEEVVVSAGEVLHIPSNYPHEAEALEDTLDVDLPQREKVVMPGWEIGDVESDSRERRHPNHLPLRNKAVRDSSLIERLDRA